MINITTKNYIKNRKLNLRILLNTTVKNLHKLLKLTEFVSLTGDVPVSRNRR